MEETGTFSVGKGVLLPLDDLARTLVGKLKVGDRVLVKVHRPRNPEVLTWLKVALGRSGFRLDAEREECGLPAFHQLLLTMSQDEFQRFWNEALAADFRAHHARSSGAGV